MNSQKHIICSQRVRQVPKQFSWVDQRLVRDRHLSRLDVCAAALYLFLVTVADSRGLSWYSDSSVARCLSVDEVRLRQARRDLADAHLIAHKGTLYQVLAIDSLSPQPQAPRYPAPDSEARPPAKPADQTRVRRNLDLLHATLQRRP